MTDVISPTPERQRRGIKLIEQRVVTRNGKKFLEGETDDKGRMIRAYRAVDTLRGMESRGSITPSMRQAGEDFRVMFYRARIDPLAACDLDRPFIDNPRRRFGTDDSEDVWLAIRCVGGWESPAGYCLWHVVGWERTLKEWALEYGWGGRKISEETASGILIAALGTLESHFNSNRRPRRK